MTKLDWSKAGHHSADPGRVVDVGDYGIVSDRLAGRKGNPIKATVKRKSKTKKPNQTAMLKPKPKKQKSNQKKSRTFHSGAGSKNGLTIADKIARSKAKACLSG